MSFEKKNQFLHLTQVNLLSSAIRKGRNITVFVLLKSETKVETVFNYLNFHHHGKGKLAFKLKIISFTNIFLDFAFKSYYLFIYCEKVRDLWLQIENFIAHRTDTVIEDSLIIEKPNHVKYFICLLVKQYIYRQRCLAKPLLIN